SGRRKTGAGPRCGQSSHGRRRPQAISSTRQENFTVQLGVQIGFWGLVMGRDEQLQATQLAEQLGYDSVWTAEAYGSDAATILAWLAGQTTRIRLGAAVFHSPGRSAAMPAMTAATIDQLSDGRMILGRGPPGPQESEGWHGVRFGRQ